MATLDRAGGRAASEERALLTVSAVGVTHLDAERAAPSDVSFAVSRGEVVLLLGPSGSGKSTLTLTLNGLIPHAIDADVTGTVRVAGRDTTTSVPAELSTHVGMVFQDPDAQIVTATVFDEVAFALENLLLPVDDILTRVEQALRRMGLWERRSDDPSVLSGGGRQRLAIACALATHAPLLVLDEPTANLDPVGIDDVYAALAEIAAAGDVGVVLVEHNLDAAVDIASRVVVIDQDGRGVFDGPVDRTLRDNADELERMGVWLPSSMIAARRLRASGWTLEPLPLTPRELDAALSSDAPVVRAVASAGRESPAGSTPGPGVSVRGLTVLRRRAPILHDVSLELPGGSFTAVIGPNGAGKTTLVQAIAGVVPPAPKTIRIGDLDPGRAAPREISATVGFVFQNPEHQFVAHTVFDELAHGLRIRRLPEDAVRERVDAMLDRFGLADHAGLHPFRLSGGQKRRLSVGTALIQGSRVLVLDEPTYGQDRARADELLQVLADLHADGTTILIVTHDLSLAARFATHTVIVDDGSIAASGTAAELLGDADLLERHGLRLPALQRVLAAHPAAADALARSGGAS